MDQTERIMGFPKGSGKDDQHSTTGDGHPAREGREHSTTGDGHPPRQGSGDGPNKQTPGGHRHNDAPDELPPRGDYTSR